MNKLFFLLVVIGLVFAQVSPKTENVAGKNVEQKSEEEFETTESDFVPPPHENATESFYTNLDASNYEKLVITKKNILVIL